jgi:hypothetical protein
MSKLNNFYNIEKEVLGEVFELPKKKETKPFDLIMEQNDFVFNSIKKLNK